MSASPAALTYTVAAAGPLHGRVRVPGDKSISHRAVILGALAEGETAITGLLEGEDVLATLAAFRAMGVEADGPHAGALRVRGAGAGGLHAPSAPLDLGNSGTAMRLLAGVLAAQPFDSVLVGDASLSRRPMRRVTEPLAAMGAAIETSPEGTPPLVLHAAPGGLRGAHYRSPVASAQVKSCLLLAGLFAVGETCVTEPVASRDHTERMLEAFGCPVRRAGTTACVSGGARLRATAVDVPADPSSAAFFLVGASIAPGSDLVLEGVGMNPARTGAIEILRAMGARIDVVASGRAGGEPVADLRVRGARLHGIAVPETLVPAAIDEFPALFVAAACAEGETRVTGAAELRVKESDRIAVMADGLARLGVAIEPTPDGARIRGGPIGSGRVASHGDHRVAMALAMAGAAAAGPVVVEDCANVATSFPGFAALARAAGLALEASGG